jgi:4,5-DOPA dioxygenase extradiol
MMPVVFIGHGSPMNALEENEYTQGWRNLAADIGKPSAILSVSAHWYTGSTGICALEKPRVIHDFYGFPKALYALDYPAPGAPAFANQTISLLNGKAVEDNTWGLDHGTWCPLLFMYPDADIPVFQMSINKNISPEDHFALGRALQPLREQNVLILGSGNIVHNLALLDMEMLGGFDWSYAFDDAIHSAVEKRSTDDVINYGRAGESARNAFFTPEHFYPLLYTLGAAGENYTVKTFNRSCTAGSLSMTSYILN